MENHNLDSVYPMCDVKLGIVGAFMHIFGFTWITNDRKLLLYHKASSFGQCVKRYQIKFHFGIVGIK